jgi:hypothetical protein
MVVFRIAIWLPEKHIPYCGKADSKVSGRAPMGHVSFRRPAGLWNALYCDAVVPDEVSKNSQSFAEVKTVLEMVEPAPPWLQLTYPQD